MKIFHICTIANDLTLYQNMKSSFLEAGFDEDKCRYTLFDNSQGNIYEPYSTFNTIKRETLEPYIILCHQDILLNQGHGFNQLVKVLEELDNMDSSWAVVGNAGGLNVDFQWVNQVTDPYPTRNWQGDFPQKVHSLDENFLLIKSSANFRCSDDLAGFHFYGTDICLNAIVEGYSCYVIDFLITHLSKGNRNQHFLEVRSHFIKKWKRIFPSCYIRNMFMHSNKVIQYLFEHKRVRNFIWSKAILRNLFSVYKKKGLYQKLSK